MRGVNGLHHITAIAGPAQENLDFYAGILGMRLVKRSVNQDAAEMAHGDAEEEEKPARPQTRRAPKTVRKRR